MSSLRRTARETLASLLETAAVGAGKPAQAVFSYRTGDFQGQSPVIVVSGYGSARRPLTPKGKKTTIYLQIDTFAAYATEDGTWTEHDAENALDEIDEIIGAVIQANQVTAAWGALDEDAKSERVDVQIGGQEYAREYRIIQVEVYG